MREDGRLFDEKLEELLSLGIPLEGVMEDVFAELDEEDRKLLGLAYGIGDADPPRPLEDIATKLATSVQEVEGRLETATEHFAGLFLAYRPS